MGCEFFTGRGYIGFRFFSLTFSVISSTEQFQYLQSKCTICNLIPSVKWYLSYYFPLTNLPERGGP